MRKISAILLLTVHLFNLTGYSLLLHYFIQRSDDNIVQQLDDNNYTDTELVELKVSMHLPYNTDWKEYERCNGQIEIEGVHYNYVKRKICNDTIYMLCIPNHDKTLLYNAKHDMAKEINDVPSGNKKSDAPFSKKVNPVNEYYFSASTLFIEISVQTQSDFAAPIALHLYSSFVPKAAQPPETIA